MAFLLQTFRNAIDFLLKSSAPKDTAARKNILLLKASLEMLKTEDRSQDMQFLNQLSTLWRKCLEDAPRLKHLASFNELVKNIQHYPENQPHTFGYYLAEYADQKWIPFPYMELIAKIHSEHKKDPASSALTEWTGLLNDLLKPESS
jgi:hypothetical protein